MPRRVAIFIEKTKDGQILPVPNVVVRDVACGANHTVSSSVFLLRVQGVDVSASVFMPCTDILGWDPTVGSFPLLYGFRLMERHGVLLAG